MAGQSLHAYHGYGDFRAGRMATSRSFLEPRRNAFSSNKMTHHHPGEIWAGVGAAMINFLAILTSQQEQLEFALRCTSLVIGILVGILTATALVIRMTKRTAAQKDD